MQSPVQSPVSGRLRASGRTGIRVLRTSGRTSMCTQYYCERRLLLFCSSPGGLQDWPRPVVVVIGKPFAYGDLSMQGVPDVHPFASALRARPYPKLRTLVLVIPDVFFCTCEGMLGLLRCSIAWLLGCSAAWLLGCSAAQPPGERAFAF